MKTETIVFGGSGFLGSHVVEQALHVGHAVTAPLRERGDGSFLARHGVTTPRLDFSRQKEIEACIAGHAVVHCCLANPRRHLPEEALRAVEVHLTRRIVAAAAAAGARRVVLLSTVMVYGFARPSLAIDETWSPHPEHPFGRVALEREVAAREAAEDAGIALAILRPVNAIGRRDRQLAPLFSAARHGLFPFFGAGDWRFSGIDARDLGRAMLLLGELPQAAGDVWLVKGYDTSWRELKAALERQTGHRSLALHVPKSVARGLGGLLEHVVPYGIEPPLTRFAVDTMATDTLFDTRKIAAAGFVPRHDLADSLADCLAGIGSGQVRW